MHYRFEQFGTSWPPPKLKSTQKFSEQEKQKLKDGFEVALQCSTLAVASADKNFSNCQKLLKTFFARDADIPRLKAGLGKMHAFMMDANRVITFVDARGQSEKILSFCEREVPGVPGAHGAKKFEFQSQRVVPMTAGDYAYVKTLKGDAADKDAATESHLGSGMRIYIGERGFHPSKTVQDTAETVYHEIDHKVLGTTDWAYKVPDCAALANTEKAIQCADSWALFVTAFVFKWPDLDWDPKDAIETRARGHAISGGKAPFAPPGGGSVGRPRSNAVGGPPPVKPGS